jgi:hypothetical protein
MADLPTPFLHAAPEPSLFEKWQQIPGKFLISVKDAGVRPPVYRRIHGPESPIDKAMSASTPIFSKTLRRDIVLLLCLKATALALVYWMFFGPDTRPATGASVIAARVLSSGNAQSSPGK